MKTNRILYLCVFVLSLVIDSSAYSDEIKEEVLEQLQEYRERMALTDDQADALKETLVAQNEERKEILESHGFEPDAGRKKNFKAMRSASGDLKELRKRTEQRLREFLSADQVSEFQKIQKEMRGNLREKMREHRKEQS